MTNIKGNELFNQKRYIIKNHGEDIFNKIIEKTDDKTKDIYSNPILSDNWYPLENYLDFIDAFEKTVSIKARQEFDIEDAKLEMNTLYRMIALFVPQKEIYKRIQKMWDTMFSEGRIYARDIADNHVILRLENFKTSNSHLNGLSLAFATIAGIISKKRTGVKMHIIDEHTTEFRMFEKPVI